MANEGLHCLPYDNRPRVDLSRERSPQVFQVFSALEAYRRVNPLFALMKSSLHRRRGEHHTEVLGRDFQPSTADVFRAMSMFFLLRSRAH